uniref:Uncharacterized protein n=1 Tax=Rhizophora mucronata TaxID=61149 RepID=A0A2P2K825_RHIMU
MPMKPLKRHTPFLGFAFYLSSASKCNVINDTSNWQIWRKTKNLLLIRGDDEFIDFEARFSHT